MLLCHGGASAREAVWWNSGSNLARLGRDGVTRALDLLAGLVHALVGGACSLGGGGVAGGPKTVFLPLFKSSHCAP